MYFFKYCHIAQKSTQTKSIIECSCKQRYFLFCLFTVWKIPMDVLHPLGRSKGSIGLLPTKNQSVVPIACLQPWERESQLHSAARPIGIDPSDPKRVTSSVATVTHRSHLSKSVHGTLCAASRTCICPDDERSKVVVRRPLPMVARDQPSGVWCFPWGGQKGQRYILYPVQPLLQRTSPPRKRKRLHSMIFRFEP